MDAKESALISAHIATYGFSTGDGSKEVGMRRIYIKVSQIYWDTLL
jgi:hypothetical protein